MAVTMTKPVRAAGLKRKGPMERKQGLESVRLGWHTGSACTVYVWLVCGVLMVTSLSLSFLCSRMVMAHPTLQSQNLAHCLKHGNCSITVSKLEYKVVSLVAVAVPSAPPPPPSRESTDM